MKINRRDNWRVELEIEKPWFFTPNDQAKVEKRWQAATDEVAAQVRRHIDGVEHVMVKWDFHEECSFCGYDWETEEDGRPLCCNAAVEEWEAQVTSHA